MASHGFHSNLGNKRMVNLTLLICTVTIVSMISQGDSFFYVQTSGSEEETEDPTEVPEEDGATEATPVTPDEFAPPPAEPGPDKPEEEAEEPEGPGESGESEIESNETGFSLSGTEMSSIHYVSIVPNDSPGNLAPAIFSPPDLTIEGGTKVVWVNNDFNTHKLTSSDFEQIIEPNGDIFEYQFNPPGIFDYYCAIHPQMTGRVTVR